MRLMRSSVITLAETVSHVADLGRPHVAISFLVVIPRDPVRRVYAYALSALEK